MATLLEVIYQACELISAPERWCSTTWGRDANHAPLTRQQITTRRKTPPQLCLAAAIIRAAPDTDTRERAVIALAAAINPTAINRGNKRETQYEQAINMISMTNDHARSHQTLLVTLRALLDKLDANPPE